MGLNRNARHILSRGSIAERSERRSWRSSWWSLRARSANNFISSVRAWMRISKNKKQTNKQNTIKHKRLNKDMSVSLTLKNPRSTGQSIHRVMNKHRVLGGIFINTRLCMLWRCLWFSWNNTISLNGLLLQMSRSAGIDQTTSATAYFCAYLSHDVGQPRSNTTRRKGVAVPSSRDNQVRLPRLKGMRLK